MSDNTGCIKDCYMCKICCSAMIEALLEQRAQDHRRETSDAEDETEMPF